MTLDTHKCAVGDLARPFTIYAGGAAVAVGVFVPSASPRLKLAPAGSRLSAWETRGFFAITRIPYYR